MSLGDGMLLKPNPIMTLTKQRQEVMQMLHSGYVGSLNSKQLASKLRDNGDDFKSYNMHTLT